MVSNKSGWQQNSKVKGVSTNYQPPKTRVIFLFYFINIKDVKYHYLYLNAFYCRPVEKLQLPVNFRKSFSSFSIHFYSITQSRYSPKQQKQINCFLHFCSVTKAALAAETKASRVIGKSKFPDDTNNVKQKCHFPKCNYVIFIAH